MTMIRNKNKLAIVTGGSEGIGAALVEELLSKNFSVVAISRSEIKLKNLNLNYQIMAITLELLEQTSLIQRS